MPKSNLDDVFLAIFGGSAANESDLDEGPRENLTVDDRLAEILGRVASDSSFTIIDAIKEIKIACNMAD